MGFVKSSLVSLTPTPRPYIPQSHAEPNLPYLLAITYSHWEMGVSTPKKKPQHWQSATIKENKLL